jgi:spore coat polysaccharide biosynthesis protein SpsF
VTPQVGAIVQARMGSSRLPGKTLRPIHGRPLLEYVLQRVRQCASLGPLVVATSRRAEDDPIDAFCASHGVSCWRGDALDVAGRFDAVLARYPMDAFVRVCGDRPFLDQALIERAVRLFAEGACDIATNAWPATYPPGQTVEVVAAPLFRDTYPRFGQDGDREHVTPFFYRHAADYRIVNFTADEDYRDVRLVVDTDDDVRIVEGIVDRMTREHWTYPVAEVARLYRSVAA